jgi:hypothetical protein
MITLDLLDLNNTQIGLAFGTVSTAMQPFLPNTPPTYTLTSNPTVSFQCSIGMEQRHTGNVGAAGGLPQVAHQQHQQQHGIHPPGCIFQHSNQR